jgi:hypothetical protein
MASKQTYYIINDVMYRFEGIENATLAADRFRSTWARAADPDSNFPFRLDDLRTAFVRENAEAVHLGFAPVSDQGMLHSIDEATEARIYALWTHNPSDEDGMGYPQPQIDVMEKRAGERRLRHVESLGLREFVSKNIGEHDADQSQLYMIKLHWDQHVLIHGRHVEHALNLIKGRENPKVGTLMEFTQDHIDQLERALEDHRRRTETLGYKL